MSPQSSAPADAAKHLRHALDGIQSSSFEAALEALLEAWRSCRSPRIAEVLAAVSALAAAERPPVAQGSHSSMDKAWMAREAERRQADVPLLLQSLNARTRSDIATRRLGVLADREADPRISKAVCAWLELAADGMSTAPWRGPSGRKFYLAALELLEKYADPECVPLLESRAANRGRHVIIARAVSQRWVALAASFVNLQSAEPDAMTLELCEQLEKLVAEAARTDGKQSAEELLQLIHDDPDDDEARLVYADRLQELGDPRGEFIQLQLERERTGGKVSRREKQLLSNHARAWLGPLDEFIMVSSLRYQRGFPYAVRFRNELGDVSPVLGAKEWLTIREADCDAGYSSRLDELFVHASWRNMRRVWGVTDAQIIELQRRGVELMWEELGFRPYSGLDGAWAQALGTVFPRLKVLDFNRVHQSPAMMVEQVASSPCAEQLEGLVLPLGNSLLAPLQWLRRLPKLSWLRVVDQSAKRPLRETEAALSSFLKPWGAVYERDGSDLNVSLWGFSEPNKSLRRLVEAPGVHAVMVHARQNHFDGLLRTLGPLCERAGVTLSVHVAKVGPR